MKKSLPGQAEIFLIYNCQLNNYNSLQAVSKSLSKIMTPELDPIAHLLWDVDRAAVDPRKHKKFIIERVLRFGTPKEVRWLLAAYSDTEIIQVVKRSRLLDKKTANFWALHYGIPREEVRCLNTPWLQNCFY